MRRALLILILGFAFEPVTPAGCWAAAEILRIEKLHDEDLEARPFRVLRPLKVQVTCKGAGDGGAEGMYAYGWILDARTREVIWALTPQTARLESDRSYVFEGPVSLPAGDFVASFAAWGGWRSRMKIVKFMGREIARIEMGKDRARRAQQDQESWGLRLHALSDADRAQVLVDTPPSAPDGREVVRITGVGDDTFEQRGFTLADRQRLTVRALGEWDAAHDGMADSGWILDASTRKRLWAIGPDNFEHAGGDAKNKQARGALTLPPGNYIVYYASDGSHSEGAWNAPPPYDPESWGIVVTAETAAAARSIRPYAESANTNTIVSLVKQPNDAYATQGLELARPVRLRVYALGEEADGRFADRGWIAEFGSRRRVWEMTLRNTQPAGGAEKNRFADEVVDLPAGEYVVGYATDDSHAYGDWNAPPPHDPEHWGITLSGVGSDFDRKTVRTFDAAARAEAGRTHLVKIVRVGSDAKERQRFRIASPTKVRIVATGEGADGQMYDFGWIEDVRTKVPVWEMTYRNTRHAGGAPKNRMFDGIVRLEAGEYEARYETDDSHAWQDWNAPPPDEPELWGLLLTVERPAP